jgi:predicted nucleic acid-binding protein
MRSKAKILMTGRSQAVRLANMDLLIAAHTASVKAVLVTSDHNFQDRCQYFDLPATVNWADDVCR